MSLFKKGLINLMMEFFTQEILVVLLLYHFEQYLRSFVEIGRNGDVWLAKKSVSNFWMHVLQNDQSYDFEAKLQCSWSNVQRNTISFF